MEKFRYWINNLKLKHKIVFFVYLVISPVFVLIATGIFLRDSQIAIQQQQEADMNAIQSLEDNITSIQSDVVNLSVYMCINSDILTILKSDEPDKLNENTRIWKTDAPIEILEDIISIKGNIKTIAIYPENGVIPYLRCLDASSYVAGIGDVRETDTYEAAIANKGDIIWKRVAKGSSDTYQANRTNKIVMYREIYDLSKKIPLGYMVMGIDEERYKELCRNTMRNEQEGIVVLSWQGEELTRVGEVDEGVLSYIQSPDYLAEDYRKRDSSFEYGGYSVFCSQSEKKGVLVCRMLPVNHQPILKVAKLPLFLLVGLLLAMYPLLTMVSQVISKPLARLSAAMDQFKQGDFTQQVEVAADDEIGEVTECFNRMVLDIKELIDRNYVMSLKEKESELLALQAQINPHFLYNTLDSLYWRTMDSGNEDLAEDIYTLSQLFRMVLGHGQGIIPVSQEIELIRCYLQIQKMRFTTRLEYEIKVENEILDYRIPKLILQPFVENAIVHGLEDQEDTGSVIVTGRRRERYLEFCIRDTGVGMTQEQIDAIWDTGDTKKYASQRIGRYAIKNVRERLELKYKDAYHLTIESEVGKGTVVTISFPADEEETCEKPIRL
ncbi:MAG: sensor histidine kinase [Lachnospiraceae bacterium]|nr:sensor histidine kinase [Lachnospiraceae bacterium]